ncbi:hypothetical protein BU25DRAFT_407664 [Macroventuria anomochaeta]|uniref:Uncharacterized protein n=1 Tax=Macroventuria anomochaeta TaxID=301207 RepID=A0ACB6SAP1_9PLEO|nr:uncharacterized protein BU25DRAFT_407664 [Macroventuria anomochaeta]KAF2631113.1 hypothetical protein BU25DRAFT_407664 [Macroventuria anomochaeta]
MDDVYAKMEKRRLSWVMSITDVIWLPMAWGLWQLHEGRDVWKSLKRRTEEVMRMPAHVRRRQDSMKNE